jgi:hypothetical protein
MVFDPSVAPSQHSQFITWYYKQTEWAEGHDYNNPSVTSSALHNWFVRIIESFPPMNGPLSKDDLPEDEASLTDYSIGSAVIYGTFAWSKAEQAYEMVFRVAAEYGVGFFDVSSGDEEVWLPHAGTLKLAHSKAD